jgi:hypothetical protein
MFKVRREVEHEEDGCCSPLRIRELLVSRVGSVQFAEWAFWGRVRKGTMVVLGPLQVR